jgi:ElaB/YqjD/DUF883 family membrane-anchored ribosome-binding protein
MDHEAEVIQQRMRAKREALADKLEALEDHLIGSVQHTATSVEQTVQNTVGAVQETVHAAKQTVDDALAAARDAIHIARDTVHETVDSAKHTVHETVAAFRETVDLDHQVQRHPWAMVGLSVAAGAAGGWCFRKVARMDSADFNSLLGFAGITQPRQTTAFGGRSSMSAPQTNGHGPTASSQPTSFLGGLLAQFGPEIDKLKSLGIGTLLGVVRDLATHAMPQNLAPPVSEVIDNVNAKLGGQHVPSPVLPGLLDAEGCREEESTEAREMPWKMSASAP